MLCTNMSCIFFHIFFRGESLGSFLIFLFLFLLKPAGVDVGTVKNG